METITLNNGVDMPALGLGVFQTPPRRTVAREDRPPRIRPGGRTRPPCPAGGVERHSRGERLPQQRFGSSRSDRVEARGQSPIRLVSSPPR